MRRPIRSLLSHCLLLVLGVQQMPAHAEGIFSVDPYVSLMQTWDDNLFRFADKRVAEAVFGSDAMSDRMRYGEAGARFTAEPGRQKLSAEFSFNQSYFDRFDFLDNDGYYRNFSWNWTLGSHFYGEITDSERRAMSGFDDSRVPALNERTTRRTAYSVHWQFHPRWRVRLQREDVEQENSLAIYRGSDREDLIYQAGIFYTTPEGNQVSFDIRQTDTEYLNRDAFSSLLFGDRSQKRDIGVGGVWNVGGKTRLEARLSRIEQTFEDHPERDVEEPGGRLGIRWQPTGKLSVSAEAVRDIYAVDDVLASYVKSDTYILSPTWQLTSKVLLQARVEHETRDYLGDAVLLGALPQREEPTDTTSLSASYLPHDKVNISLTWVKEERESNRPFAGYDASTVNASVRVDF